MIYPEVNIFDWEIKTGVEKSYYKCPVCKARVAIDTPVVTKDSHGLISKDHGCGKGMVSAILTPRTNDAKYFWSEVLEYCKGEGNE